MTQCATPWHGFATDATQAPAAAELPAEEIDEDSEIAIKLTKDPPDPPFDIQQVSLPLLQSGDRVLSGVGIT